MSNIENIKNPSTISRDTRAFPYFVLYLILISICIIVLIKFVVPVYKLFNQKKIEQSLQVELSEIETNNKNLASQISNYRKDSSIQDLAQEKYNLVYPGQQIFVFLP